MNSKPNKKIAFFKREPSRSVPARTFGPLQITRNCRNCGNCISFNENYRSTDLTNPFKSFDNLIVRKSIWLSNYQSIQYHVGQFDVLKQIINSNASQPFVFVVAATRSSDLKYLQWVLDYMKLPKLKHIVPNMPSATSMDNTALLIEHKSCSVNKYFGTVDGRKNFISLTQLRQHISNWIKRDVLKPFIVPVIITKDHDFITTLSLGSVSIQVLEPFFVANYDINLYQESSATHMTLHIYHDLNKFSIILPANIVAFLILYLNRSDGVSYDDLIDYMNWFIKCSLDFELHLGFTGKINHAVDFGLLLLKDYLFERNNKTFHIKEEEKLMDYGNVLVPTIAYYGIISQSIMIEHNKSNQDKLLTCFTPNLFVRVSKDNVFEIAESLSNILEKNITCKRPCETANRKLEDIFATMCSFKHYFKLEEPLHKPEVRIWDFEFDDGQYDRRNNLYCQSWINVTQRPYRLDRLNLFMNAISSYIINYE